MTHSRPLRVVVGLLLGALVLSGCGFKGAYSLPLPGGAATGKTYDITAVFNDVQDLVPQNAVRVNDVAVGDVTGITLGKDLRAHVRMKIRANVHLPANTVATLEQTTLLGEKYVDLGPPAGNPGVGTIADNATIPESKTSDLPDVEEVFGALSNVLNGGSLQDLETINVEVTKALSGRESQVRGALHQLDTFVGSLNSQKQQIVRALVQLNRFSAGLARQTGTISTALTSLGPGLKVLADERAQFTGLLTDLSTFGKVATRVINASRADTVADLRDLKPILGHLAAAGSNLPHSLEILITFPFPKEITHDAPGDYTGLRLSFDADANLCALLNLAGLGALLPTCQDTSVTTGATSSGSSTPKSSGGSASSGSGAGAGGGSTTVKKLKGILKKKVTTVTPKLPVPLPTSSGLLGGLMNGVSGSST